jgi:hypothetical protein
MGPGIGYKARSFSRGAARAVRYSVKFVPLSVTGRASKACNVVSEMPWRTRDNEVHRNCGDHTDFSVFGRDFAGSEHFFTSQMGHVNCARSSSKNRLVH